jgi:glutamate racemase
VVERFANGVELLQDTCPGLVQQIEKGDLNGVQTRGILENALKPMLQKNIDTVVLACTHYPFVIPLIQQIAGEKVRVIDPAPAVARQAKRLLEENGLKRPSGPRREIGFFTSGDAGFVQSLLPKLLGEEGTVKQLHWNGDKTLKKK